jgi:hypothetical protein
MDPVLINQLQFYTPPQLIKRILSNQDKCFQIAKYIIDKEFRHKPQRWKTIAFPDYEDFFQAAVSGFNPYKKTSLAKDKGLLQAVDTYNPYKRQSEEGEEINLITLNEEEQATCPYCFKRGETVSLWPSSAGNQTIESHLAPDPLFFKGNKYCGMEIEEGSSIAEWTERDLIRKSGKKYLCNYKNRLASLKNYILSQIGFLVQDIRTAEYHSSRSLKKHPFYPCPQCSTLAPDFNTSSLKTETLDCIKCNHTFSIKEFETKKSSIVWQARSVTNVISFNDQSDEDGRTLYEEIILNYGITTTTSDPTVYHNNIESERSELFDQLVSRIRELAASCLSQKQFQKLLQDPSVKKVEGVPETQNFQIFYNYFFMDDLEKKKEHEGRAKNKSDETSTYRELALKFLQKEQHYTKCLSCNNKMYEPTESAKFKRSGTKVACEECNSTSVQYHGPKCGTPGSLNPSCKDHGDVEIVMYIFQTIEPKIRRLEELVRNDKQAKELYDRIRELLQARDELDSFQDMVKLLNY